MRNRITYLLACLVVSSGSLAQSIYKDNSYSPAERAEDLVKQLTLEEKVALMMDNSKPVERHQAVQLVERGLARSGPQRLGNRISATHRHGGFILSRSPAHRFRRRIR